ncbi:MAG: exosortase A [Rhodocyclaceae bacterium]
MMMPEPHVAAAAARARPARLQLSAGILAFVAVLAVYYPTVWSMVSIWRHSETFAHGMIVLPLSAWLVWRARHDIRAAGGAPAWSALLGVAAFGCLWFVGQVAIVNAASQFGVVGMALCALWVCWGHRAAWAAFFPLTFLFFAVPFGDFMVPALMSHTADFVVAALRASGVPVYREGLFFIVPTGAWSVVEACSGIRYLIASTMVGALFAYLNYRSARRRALFFAAAIAVPLVANWLRAYIIVMLGHLSNNRLAAGVDHLVYGWLFFGIVIFLLFWIGAGWREAPVARRAPTTFAAPAPGGRIALSLLAALVVGLMPAAARDGAVTSRPLPRVELHAIAPLGGWQTSLTPAMRHWHPLYEGARAQYMQSYRRDDAVVTLRIDYYAGQSPQRELVQWQNRLFVAEEMTWRAVSSQALTVAGQPVREVAIAGPERLLVWQWLWLDGSHTVSDRSAKIALLRARLLHGRDDGAAVFLTADATGGVDVARTALHDFLQQHAAAIDRALAQARP